jgi:hypothetical protein
MALSIHYVRCKSLPASLTKRKRIIIMGVWDKYDYWVSYIDPNEMSRRWVKTNIENIGEIIQHVFDKGGFKVEILKYKGE